MNYRLNLCLKISAERVGGLITKELFLPDSPRNDLGDLRLALLVFNKRNRFKIKIYLSTYSTIIANPS